MSITNISSSSCSFSSLAFSSSSSSSSSKTYKGAAVEQFKNNLKDYFLWEGETIPKTAEMLFQKIPQGMTLAEIVDMIFTVRKYDHAYFLKAFLYAHPEYTLSPYDTIRRAIIEDIQHTLTNRSIKEMFKKEGLEGDEDKFGGCCDLAFRINHPYIYQLAEKPIPTGDYTLNFLWINLNPQDRIQDKAQNIFGEGLDPCENADCIKDPETLRYLHTSENTLPKEDVDNWKAIQQTFTYKLSQWADKQPSAQINVWYDSALVTYTAQQKTFGMMRSIAASRGVDLRLRDIHHLTNVTGEIRYTLHPGTPVYLRVDLVKILIADFMMSSPKEKTKYCVVSDIDVRPMTVDQLFDRRTLQYLSLQGYVFNRVGLHNFENSFFIFNKHKETIAQIHHEEMIDSFAWTIKDLRRYPLGTSFRSDFILGAQGAFNNYPRFLEKVGEEFGGNHPRKVVACPPSQFNFGGDFLDSDHRTEIFRFIGDSNMPYTRNGRTSGHYEGHIQALIGWHVEPLKNPNLYSHIFQIIIDYTNIPSFSPDALKLREVFSEQMRV